MDVIFHFQIQFAQSDRCDIHRSSSVSQMDVIFHSQVQFGLRINEALSQSVRRSASQSVSQWINQSIQSDGCHIHRCSQTLVRELHSLSPRQSVSGWINQSVGQSFASKPLNGSVKRSVGSWVSQWVSYTVDKPVIQSVRWGWRFTRRPNSVLVEGLRSRSIRQSVSQWINQSVNQMDVILHSHTRAVHSVMSSDQ